MHRPAYGIFSTAASALMALFGQGLSTGPSVVHSFSFFPASRMFRHSGKRRYKGRTGKRYQTGNGERENVRNARLAAKMRATRTMNDDMLVRHRPKNSGSGMDISRPSRQVLRAEQRRTAKTRASRMKDAHIPANWRQFIEMDKATASARATG